MCKYILFLVQISMQMHTRENYPKAHDGFINAFAVMRQAVNTLRDGCEVTVARRYREALSLITQERFDVVIVDLGWGGDRDVPRVIERTAAYGRL
jgi:hypothetical protein